MCVLADNWSSGMVPFGCGVRWMHFRRERVSTTSPTTGLRRRSWLYDGSAFSLYHRVEQSESVVDEPQLRNLWMDDERLVAGVAASVTACQTCARELDTIPPRCRTGGELGRQRRRWDAGPDAGAGQGDGRTGGTVLPEAAHHAASRRGPNADWFRASAEERRGW